MAAGAPAPPPPKEGRGGRGQPNAKPAAGGRGWSAGAPRSENVPAIVVVWSGAGPTGAHKPRFPRRHGGGDQGRLGARGCGDPELPAAPAKQLPPRGLPGCHPRPAPGSRLPRQPHAPAQLSPAGSDVLHLPSEGAARRGGGAEVPSLLPVGSARGAGRQTPGESPLPAAAAHGRAAAMGLLLRALLLCGVAGERGQLCAVDPH